VRVYTNVHLQGDTKKAENHCSKLTEKYNVQRQNFTRFHTPETDRQGDGPWDPQFKVETRIQCSLGYTGTACTSLASCGCWITLPPLSLSLQGIMQQALKLP